MIAHRCQGHSNVRSVGTECHTTVLMRAKECCAQTNTYANIRTAHTQRTRKTCSNVILFETPLRCGASTQSVQSVQSVVCFVVWCSVLCGGVASYAAGCGGFCSGAGKSDRQIAQHRCFELTVGVSVCLCLSVCSCECRNDFGFPYACVLICV